MKPRLKATKTGSGESLPRKKALPRKRQSPFLIVL